MNWFGKKKKAEASTTSSGSSGAGSDPQSTIVRLREAVSTQEKRWVENIKISFYPRTSLRTAFLAACGKDDILSYRHNTRTPMQLWTALQFP